MKGGRHTTLSDKEVTRRHGKGYSTTVQVITVKQCTPTIMEFEHDGEGQHCKIGRLKKALRQK